MYAFEIVSLVCCAHVIYCHLASPVFIRFAHVIYCHLASPVFVRFAHVIYCHLASPVFVRFDVIYCHLASPSFFVILNILHFDLDCQSDNKQMINPVIYGGDQKTSPYCQAIYGLFLLPLKDSVNNSLSF